MNAKLRKEIEEYYNVVKYKRYDSMMTIRSTLFSKMLVYKDRHSAQYFSNACISEHHDCFFWFVISDNTLS